MLTPIALNLSGYHLVLANPGIHVATGWAFGQIQPQMPERPIEEIVTLPIDQWKKAGIKNDFEEPVFRNSLIISSVHTAMVEKGADFTAMSGTGSTCFGIFSKDPGLSAIDFPTGTLVKSFVL